MYHVCACMCGPLVSHTGALLKPWPGEGVGVLTQAQAGLGGALCCVCVCVCVCVPVNGNLYVKGVLNLQLLVWVADVSQCVRSTFFLSFMSVSLHVWVADGSQCVRSIISLPP